MAKRLTQCLILCLLALGLLGQSGLGGQPQSVAAAIGETAPPLQENGPRAVNSPSANAVLLLDGSNSYVTVPYDAALNPTGAFTLEAWVRRDNDNRCETIIRKSYDYFLGFCNVVIYFYASGGINAEGGTTAIPANVWTHIAVVYEGSGRKYYVNGELDYTGGPEVAPTTSVTDLTIGGHPTITSYDFDGRISNVRVWNVARTQDEIRRTMHVALEEPLPGLVANWRFSEGHEDNIGGYNGTPAGVSLIFANAPAQPVYADVVDVNFNTLPQGRYGAATVYLPARDEALLIGGQRTSAVVLADVHAVDGTTGARTTRGSLPAARTYPAAVYAPTTDQAYVFGGGSTYLFNDSAQDAIYKVDPDSGAATTLSATLPVASAALEAVYHSSQDKVYLFGGINAGGVLTDVLVFDPATETIASAGFALPQGLLEITAAYSEATDRFFLFGGNNGSRIDTIYEVHLDADGVNGSISALPTVLPRNTDALGAFEDPHTQLIYLIGGYGQDYIWVFDPVTTEIWQTRIAIPSEMRDPSIAFSQRNRHALIIGGAFSLSDQNVWRVPLGDGPLVPLGFWDFPASADAAVTSIDGEADGVVVTTLGNGAWLYQGDGSRYHYTAAILGSTNGRVNDGRYKASNGDVYLATDDAGVKIDVGASFITYNSATFGTNDILSIDDAGYYAPNGQGVWWRALNPITLNYYWVHDFGTDFVKALAPRTSRDVWLLASDNLKRLQTSLLGGSTETNFGSRCSLLSPTDLEFGVNGDWWIVSPGTFEFGGNGICRIPAAETPGSGSTVPVDAALGNWAASVDVDGDGRIWVALVDNESGGSGGLAVFEVTGGSTAVVRTTEYNWFNAPVGSRTAYVASTPAYWDSSFTAVGAADERAWAGKYDGRLVTLAQRWQQLDESNDVGDKVVQNVWTVRGRTFLGTSNSFHVLRPDGVTWQNFASTKVWDVMGDSRGRIWVATNTGIRLYTPAGWDYLTDKPGDRPNTATYALAEDQDGRVWIGGLHGLTLFDRERFVATFTPSNAPLPEDTFRTLFVDRDNRLWAGTDVGLVQLDGAEWTTFTTADGLVNNAIFDLDQTGTGEVAISTANGVSFYDEMFTNQSMPFDDSYLPLSVDETGRLWAGGAVKIGSSWQIYYTTNSGLASDEISDNAADGADRIWFSHAPDTGVSVRGTYLPPLANVVPIVSGVSPTTGTSGDELTITGSGFGTRSTDVRVTVGQAEATIVSVSSTEIRVQLTDQNTSGDVSVTVGGRRSTLTDGFCAIPQLTSFSPTGGNDGVRIDIFGTNFDPNADVRLGSPTDRAAYHADATHLWLDVRSTAGTGSVQVINHCGDTAASTEQFRRIDLSLQQIVLNQGIQGAGLVADRRTMVQHYLSHSVAPRDTDRLEIDFVELTFTEGGAPQTFGLRVEGAFNTTAGAPPVALLRDIVNSINVNITPNLDGSLIPGDNVQVHSVLKRAGQTVAQGDVTAWFRSNQPVRVLLVPIMRNTYNDADLRTMRQMVDANLSELRSRIWPTGHVEFYWSPIIYRATDVILFGGETIDIGDTLTLYDASHNIDSARRWWNETHDPDVMVAFGVVDPPVNDGNASGKAFWPNLSQMLNLAGFEALDTLCDIGATAVNILTLGLADASCDLEIPLYVGWGEASGNASELIGHEMGHIFNLVRAVAPNGDLTDNFTHSVFDEIDDGECGAELDSGAIFNPAKTLYQSVGVNEPVVNPLTGQQLRANLTMTDTAVFGGDSPVTVTSEALFRRGKAIMSYACRRGNTNSFFEPVDVVGVYYEYAASAARFFFDDLLPGRMMSPSTTYPTASAAPSAVTPNFVPGTRLYVSGVVDRAAPSGAFRRVEVLGDVAPLDISYQTSYWLVQLDGASQEITRTGVFPVFTTADAGLSDGPAEIDTGFFAATVLAQSGLARLELRYEETLLDSLSAGSAAPTVNLTSPVGGGEYGGSGEIPVVWSANDTDGDDLMITILYSMDDGASWSPVGFSDQASATFQLPAINVGGSAVARIKVVASDGFHSGEATSAAFKVASRPPVPYIGTPVDGDSFLEGQVVHLSGGAFDAQDGALTGAALVWSSDRDGALGTGETLDVVLSVGTHMVALEATNSKGHSESVAVTITVMGDYDFDGIADEDELDEGLNLLTSSDAFSDDDEDDLPLVMERARGLNPGESDSDNDGRDDDVEIAEGTDPASPDAPLPADALVASPVSLTFDVDVSLGTAMPQEQVILSSRDPVSWTLTSDVDWLASVRIEGKTPGSTTIIVNTEKLSADGTYTGNLFFDSDLGMVTVPVTATITNLVVEPGMQYVYLPLVLR